MSVIMKKEKTVTACIRIREKDDILLKKIAIAKGNISKSNMIRMAISEYIQRNKQLIEEN